MDTHNPDDAASPDALHLAAEEAEAEAAEAEALAAAARAKAKAIRLRREADETQKAAVAADEQAVVTSAASAPADTDESADAGEAVAAPKTRASGRLSVVAATLIVVLSLVLLAFGGWKAWQLHELTVAKEHQAIEQHRKAEFAAAAAQGVVNLMSLDYRHAKEDVQRIIDGTTGDFKKDFQGTAGDFIKVAETSKSVTKATVTATAVQAVAQDNATVLVAATTTVANAASKEQPPRSWRWSVDVIREGGQIKLAKVEIVP